MPSSNTHAAAGQNDDMEAARISANPLTNEANRNDARFGSSFWTNDSAPTPRATPKPNAVMNNEKVSPEPITFSANTGPRGTSIAAPNSPVASPTLTPRTTGFPMIKRQPSRMSENVCPMPAARSSPTTLPPSACLGIRTNFQMISAPITNDAALK